MLEPMQMARWHLCRALEYATRDELADETGLSKTALSNIQYGMCEMVPLGTTKNLRRIEKRLRAENRTNPWADFLADDDTRMEVARLRATDPEVVRIRRALVEKASK